MAWMILVSSCPARPTNGSPWASSSAPGASPTKTRRALGLPTPKTIWVRWRESLHRVHSPSSSRTSLRVAGAAAAGDSGHLTSVYSRPSSRCARRYARTSPTISRISARGSLATAHSRAALLHEVDDAIENPVGHRPLTLQGEVLHASLGIQDLHRVGVAVKAGAGLADIIGHHQVHMFPLEFLPGIGHQVFRLGGKPD